MAHSIVTYPGSGTAGPFVVNFTLGYLSQAHVTAWVVDEVDLEGNQLYRTLTWINSGLVSVSGAAVAPGQTLIISRDTPVTSAVHDYADGAVLDETSLDESNLQNIMLAQESLDGKRQYVLYDNLDAAGFTIKNLGSLEVPAPTTDSSAVPRSFVDSGLISYAEATKVTMADDAASSSADAIASAASAAAAGLSEVAAAASAASAALYTDADTLEGHNAEYFSDAATLSGVAVGDVVKLYSTISSAVVSTSVSIPVDDTIPQRTEGGEVLALTVVPKAATNKLLVRVSVYATNSSTSSAWSAALFKDYVISGVTTAANYAVAARQSIGTNSGGNACVFEFICTAGVVDNITFRVRIGGSSALALHLNGTSSGTRLYGGVCSSSITVTEIRG